MTEHLFVDTIILSQASALSRTVVPMICLLYLSYQKTIIKKKICQVLEKHTKKRHTTSRECLTYCEIVLVSLVITVILDGKVLI